MRKGSSVDRQKVCMCVCVCVCVCVYVYVCVSICACECECESDKRKRVDCYVQWTQQRRERVPLDPVKRLCSFPYANVDKSVVIIEDG